jgi:hypothetical protein
VTPWDEAAGTVTSSRSPGSGALSVADPRYPNWHPGASSAKLRVTDWRTPAFTVTGAQQVASGALSVADPRPDFARDGRDSYLTAGHYGVLPFDAPAVPSPERASMTTAAGRSPIRARCMSRGRAT